jgi:hypothetical protein
MQAANLDKERLSNSLPGALNIQNLVCTIYTIKTQAGLLGFCLFAADPKKLIAEAQGMPRKAQKSIFVCNSLCPRGLCGEIPFGVVWDRARVLHSA